MKLYVALGGIGCQTLMALEKRLASESDVSFVYSDTDQYTGSYIPSERFFHIPNFSNGFGGNFELGKSVLYMDHISGFDSYFEIPEGERTIDITLVTSSFGGFGAGAVLGIADFINSILRRKVSECVTIAHCDKAIIRPLVNALVKKDYSVWTPEDNLEPGQTWPKQISDAIIRCAYKGFYIVVITQESVKSSFVERELAFASSQGAWIIPIVIGHPEMPEDIRRWLGNYHQMSVEPTEEDFTGIVDSLDDFLKKKMS